MSLNAWCRVVLCCFLALGVHKLGASTQTTVVIDNRTNVPASRTLYEMDRLSKEIVKAKAVNPETEVRIVIEKGADPDVVTTIHSMIAGSSAYWEDRRPYDLTNGVPPGFRGGRAADIRYYVARGIDKLNQIAKTNAFDLVLFGDSITHYWEKERACSKSDSYERLCARFSVLNIATAGNRVEDAIWYAQHGFLDGYRAKAMMQMIGTNNGGIPEVVSGVARLLEIIREKQPDIVVFLSPIFPTVWYSSTKTNEALRALCDDKQVVWCDFNDKLLVDGKATRMIFRDGIHLSKLGYEIWLREMMPRFESVIEDRKKELK